MKKFLAFIAVLLISSSILTAQNDTNSSQKSTNGQSESGNIQKDYKNYPYWVEMMQDPAANFYETQKAFNEYWEGREVTRGSGYKPFKRWEYWMNRRVSADGTKPTLQKNIDEIMAIKANSLTSGSESARSQGNRTTVGDWTSLGPVNVPSGNNGYRGLGRVNAFAFHPTNANIIYAGTPSGGLWITYDGGASWTTYTDGMPTLGVSAIVVDYNNPSIVYIGTGDRDAGDAPGSGVWKSTDGGITFQPSNTGITTVTVAKLIQHPTNPSILIAATNTGIWRSTDAGASWTRTYASNFKDVVFKPNNPDIVYASANGLFYRSTNNGVSFTQITTGLGSSAYRGAIAVTPANPDYVYFVVTTTTSFYGLVRSTDAGLTFSTRSTTPNIMSWDCNGGSGGQAWYDLDIAADPVNPEIIFAGGVNNFKSTNGGSTWSISSHWYGGCGVPSVHADLHVMEYNPLNGRLYAGNDGGVYWTGNAGTSWTEISNGLIISQAYAIGQSATSRNLVINGYQDNGTSTYTGSSWVNVNGGDGMECAYDPANSSYSYSTLYYGTITRHFNNVDQGDIAGEGVNGITEDGAWVTPFVIDHNDGNTMFVGYDNVWRSINIKASITDYVSWTKISNFPLTDLDEMAQSYANTNILYVSESATLYRSDNVKETSPTWTNITSTLPTSNYITAIETHPTNENIIYLAAQNQVYMSSNKGVNWTSITGSLPGIQVHTLVCDHHSTTQGMYAGTDIGVYYRDENNPNWIRFSEGMPYAAWVTDLEIYYDDANHANDILRAGTYGRGLWESPLYEEGTVLPGPAGPISGLQAVCQGQSSVTYSIPVITNATSYVWSLPSGATGSSSTNSISVSFGNNAVSGDISVYGVNTGGNGTPATLYVTVNPLPGAAGTIAGDQSVCQGETGVTYSVPSVSNATSYTWSLPSGASGSSTSNSITVNFSSNAISGDISVYASNSCGSGAPSTLSITVNALPGDAGTISGNQTVCQGETGVTYTIPAVSNATSYTWSLPSGATGSSSTNSITVNYGSNAVSGNITVYASNECGSGSTSTLNVTVNALPGDAGTISGNQTVCQGETGITYTVSPISNATSYTWSLPSGATGSSSTNSITVSYGSNAVSGNISVFASNSCGEGESSSLNITVNSLPDDAGTISGNQTVCQGETGVTYTIPAVSNATSYVWSLPSGATGSSTTTSITVNYESNAVSGTISVYASNSCGEGESSSLNITVNSLPDDAGTISGDQTVCQGETGVTYTIPAVSNATSYTWSLPSGATGSSSTNSITVSYGSNAVSGTISVYASNSCGEGESSSLSITVNVLPGAAGSISGDQTVCQGETGVTYTVPAISNATSYIWSLPFGATGTSNTNSITLNFGTNALSGLLVVKGTNQCGIGQSSSLMINVNPKPATPVVTQNSNILHSSAAEGNQWYDLTGPVEGATNQDYEVIVTGDYYTIVTQNDCPSDPSNVVHVVITSTQDNAITDSFNVYPNPFTHELTIENKSLEGSAEYEIIDANGQIITKGMLTDKVILSTEKFAAGVYLIKIQSDNLLIKKLVKTL